MNCQTRTCSRSGMKDRLATDEPGSLANTKYAKGLVAVILQQFGVYVKTTTVVFHNQIHPIAITPKIHADLVYRAMPDGVRDRLLSNSVERSLHITWQPAVIRARKFQ